MNAARSIVPYGQTYRAISGGEVIQAAMLWKAGKDTAHIAQVLLIHESRVMQLIESIKEIARTLG